MVSIALLILAPILLGAIIFGTTLILSKSDKKTPVNPGLGNFTTTAQLVTTALIPDKVATTVSLVFAATPPVVSTLSALPTTLVKDVDSPTTTAKIVQQSPVKEEPLPSTPPLTKTSTAEDVAGFSRPTPTTTTTKDVEVVIKPSLTTTTTSSTKTTNAEDVPVFSKPTPTITTIKDVAVVIKSSPTTIITTTTTTTTLTTTTTTTTTTAKAAPKSTTTATTAAVMVATVATAATTTTSAASPTPTKGSGWSIFPGITVPNPFDIFKPTDPPKPSTTLGPTTTTTTTAVVKTATTTASTTTAASPSPTKKSGWSLFPGITIPNPFELFPHNHGRDPIKGNTESLARQGPAMVDAIDNNDDEQEDDYTEDDHSDFNDKQEDEEKDKEEVEQFKQRVKHDHQSPAEVDTNEDWDDEEVEPKQQANKGGQQKVLKQRSVEKKRRHHHHRRNNQKRHLVRRQTLSFHDVVQIARTISVSPPIKTMHLLTETPTSTPTPVAEAPIALPYTSVHVDPKDVLFKDAHSKKEEKPSAPPASPQSTASETDDPNIEEFESVIAQLVDEQAASFEESLAVIVNNIIQSDEMEPYEDLLFGRIVISKLEIPDINDDNALDFNTDDKVDTLYSFRASPSSKDSVFKGPRAVSRVSILTSIINTLLPPFILHFRADLRNFLYWICSPTSSAHINGRDTSGDDSWAEKIAKEDADKLIHPDGSIDLKALWDPRIGTIVLDCIRSHAQNVVNEVVGLAGTRFTEIKEFLVAQLRGLIGLPKWLLPFSSGSVSVDAQPTVDPSGQLQQNTEQEANEAEVHGADSQADVDLEEDNLTQKVEIEHAAVIVVQEETIPSPIHPDQRRRPSPASDSAQSLRKVQRTDSKFDDTDKTDEFLAWFVDSVVDELQNGYFANAKAATVSRVKSTKSQPTNSNGDPDEAGEYACAWIKERVEKVLQSLLQ